MLAQWDAVIRLLLVNRNATPDFNLQSATQQLNKLLQDIRASEVSQDTWRLMIEQQVLPPAAASLLLVRGMYSCVAVLHGQSVHSSSLKSCTGAEQVMLATIWCILLYCATMTAVAR